ncbi:Bug family tripartite tricarboxylate transporter substrate binding protein [Reyranella sp.]|uniref:Bug family tripartite tricarboxylate transporter substrate binding protein n=1 Tax=Reyranella sp. TaxID=1929291 RepID=UPI00351E998F
MPAEHSWERRLPLPSSPARALPKATDPRVRSAGSSPVAAGRARVLAVTSLKRSVALPDVPTLAESGYPDFDLNDWNGLFAATGIPPALVDRMQAVVAEAIKDPKVRERLDPTGADLVANTPV